MGIAQFQHSISTVVYEGTDKEKPHTYEVKCICALCQEPNTFLVPADVYNNLVAGINVGEAWPNSTPNQREPLIRGWHSKCFDDLLGVTEDDDWS